METKDKLNRSVSKASDAQLIARTRRGDMTAYAELWQRHQSAAIKVARAFTSSVEAEDLVSEAYTQVLVALQRGGGPQHSAFRPYLYTVIRNLACRWGAAQQEITVDELPEHGEEHDSLDAQLDSLDHGIVRHAFDSLPRRWQEVLWYTEVEQMTPAKVGQLLGVEANNVSALAYRAREGLRQHWLQGHVSHAVKKGECAWVLSRLGEHSRGRSTKRNAARLERHLDECRSCLGVSLEVDTVSNQLAGALIPAVVGGTIGGGLLSLSHAGGAAVAAGAGASATGVGLTTAGVIGVGATSAVALLVILGGGGFPLPLHSEGSTQHSLVQPDSYSDDSAEHDLGDRMKDGTGGFEPHPGFELRELVAEQTSGGLRLGGLLNSVTEEVSELVDGVTDGHVGADVETDLDLTSPSVSVDLSVGEAGAGVGAEVGEGEIDVSLGVDGILDLDLNIGGDGNLLGIGLFE